MYAVARQTRQRTAASRKAATTGADENAVGNNVKVLGATKQVLADLTGSENNRGNVGAVGKGGKAKIGAVGGGGLGGAAAAGRKRAALGDVSNVLQPQKTAGITKASKAKGAVTKKATTGRPRPTTTAVAAANVVVAIKKPRARTVAAPKQQQEQQQQQLIGAKEPSAKPVGTKKVTSKTQSKPQERSTAAQEKLEPQAKPNRPVADEIAVNGEQGVKQKHAVLQEQPSVPLEKPVPVKEVALQDVLMEKVEEWDDLDTPEMDEPTTVAEYAPEIFKYLMSCEMGTMPHPDYVRYQVDNVTWEMRDIMVDWLIEVHQKFRMTPETLYLAVNLLDRYLSLVQVTIDKLQLVAITALFVASKVEEIMIPNIDEFAYLADNTYTTEEIRVTERRVLAAINFKLSYPNPMNFLRRISKADDYDIHSRTIAKYLMEIGIVDHRFLRCQPSLLAAGAMYLARKILDRGRWDANLTHYSCYREEEILPVVEMMLDYVRNPRHEEFFKKYASKKFYKASITVRDWYHDRYEQESD